MPAKHPVRGIELYSFCPHRLHDRSNTNNVDMQDFKTLHKFLEEMNQSFQLHDTDRSGSLNANETHAALTSAGRFPELLTCLTTFWHLSHVHAGSHSLLKVFH